MTGNKFEATCDGCGLRVAPGAGIVSGEVGARMVTHRECAPPNARLLPLARRSPEWPVARSGRRRTAPSRLLVAAAVVGGVLAATLLLVARGRPHATDEQRIAQLSAGPSTIVVTPVVSSPTTTMRAQGAGLVLAPSAAERTTESTVAPAAEASVQTVPPRPVGNEVAIASKAAAPASTTATSVAAPTTTVAAPTAAAAAPVPPTTAAAARTNAPPAAKPSDKSKKNSNKDD